MTDLPDEVTTAASIVAMRLMAENLTKWHELVGKVVHTDLALGYPKLSAEWCRLIQEAILATAMAMQPERKLYDAALHTLTVATRHAAAAAKGVD
jgi:hypothetical protein